VAFQESLRDGTSSRRSHKVSSVHEALAHKGDGGVWWGSSGAEGTQSLCLQTEQLETSDPWQIHRQTDRHTPTHALRRQVEFPAT